MNGAEAIGFLDAAPFRAILAKRLEEFRTLDIPNPNAQLALDVGLSSRGLLRILNGQQEKVEFDTADRIVTRVLGPLAWHEDESLSEMYWTADLHSLDWAYPTSDVVLEEMGEIARLAYEEHGSLERGANALGVGATAFRRALGHEPTPRVSNRQRGREPKEFRKPICDKGHDKRVTGVHSGGGCSVCRREASREAQREKRGSIRRYHKEGS